VSEFIDNPRRAPRATSRCGTHVRIPGASFEAETEDVGPLGCQLVAPNALPRGMAIQLTIVNPRLAEALRLAGKVAWVTPAKAAGSRTQGVGIQFPRDEKTHALKLRIEEILGAHLSSDRSTQTI